MAGRKGSRTPQRKFSQIGLNLRDLRSAKGLTLEQLAERTGLRATHISAIEHGERRNPSSETLDALAAGLGIRVDEILRGTDEAQMPKGLAELIASGLGGQVSAEEIEKLKRAQLALGAPATLGTYLRLLDILRMKPVEQ